ncbi:cache domain-containing protein [Halochromatium sp.]
MRTVPLQRRLLRNLLAVLLPLGLVVTATAMFATRMAAEDMARSLTRQSIKQTSDELELYFASIDRLLGATRDWARSGLLGFDEVDQLRRLMQPLLANEPQVSSFLLADEQGHELMLLQTHQGWRLRQTDPAQPGEARWLAWQGDPAAPATVSVKPTDIDPRQRPWFSGAIKAEGAQGNPQVHWTGPYELMTTGESGITASIASRGPGGERQVVALDVLLLDITRFTRDLALSERGGVIVLDDQAQLIGLPPDPRLSKLDAREQRLPQDRSAGSASDHAWPPLSDAETAFSRADEATQLIRFRSEGKACWGARKPFPLGPEQRLWIEVLVPESELLDGPI